MAAAATTAACRTATSTRASATATTVRSTPTRGATSTASAMRAAGSSASAAARATPAVKAAMASGKAAALSLQRATVVGDGRGNGCDSSSVHDLVGHVEGLLLGIEGQWYTLGGRQSSPSQSVFHHVGLHMRSLDTG